MQVTPEDRSVSNDNRSAQTSSFIDTTKGSGLNLENERVSEWAKSPPQTRAPTLINSEQIPRGAICTISSGLFRFSRALSQMGRDTSSLSGTLLFVPSLIIGFVNEPLRALSGMALRAFSADDILLRIAYDTANRELRHVVRQGCSYFGTSTQEKRFDLASHCLAKAIEIGDEELQRACDPRRFGIEDPALKKRLFRMLAAYAEPDPHFGLLRASDINSTDHEFRVEILSHALSQGTNWHWFVEGIELDQIGHLQAHKNHLESLANVASEQRITGISSHFGEIGVRDTTLRAELAKEYMKLVPHDTCQAISRFGLKDAPDIRFELAMQAADMGCASVMKCLKSFELDTNQNTLVMERILETNFAGALPYLPKSFTPLSSEQYEKLFCISLEEGYWSNARKLCELQRTESDAVVDRSVVEADFKNLFLKVSNESRISAETCEALKTILAIGYAPSDIIGTGLKYFGSDNRGLLVSILTSYGETFGSSIINEMKAIFSNPAQLSATEIDTVKDFLNHGFRGFSRSTYETFRDMWHEDRLKASDLVKGWKLLSQEILNGRPLNSELTANPLFPELVYSAYRPSGMTLHQVRNILRVQSDRSSDCTRFRTPENGYQVSVVDILKQSIKSGEKLDTTAIRARLEILTNTDSEAKFDSSDFLKLARRGLLGDFDSLRKYRGELLRFLIDDSRFEQGRSLVAELRTLQSRGFGQGDS